MVEERKISENTRNILSLRRIIVPQSQDWENWLIAKSFVSVLRHPFESTARKFTFLDAVLGCYIPRFLHCMYMWELRYSCILYLDTRKICFQLHAPADLFPVNEPPVPIRRLGGTQSRSVRCSEETISALSGIEPQSFVSSRPLPPQYFSPNHT